MEWYPGGRCYFLTGGAGLGGCLGKRLLLWAMLSIFVAVRMSSGPIDKHLVVLSAGNWVLGASTGMMGRDAPGLGPWGWTGVGARS